MYVCITYIHTYIHTYLIRTQHVYTYVYTYIHTYVYTYIRIYIHTYIHTYVWHVYLNCLACACAHSCVCRQGLKDKKDCVVLSSWCHVTWSSRRGMSHVMRWPWGMRQHLAVRVREQERARARGEKCNISGILHDTEAGCFWLSNAVRFGGCWWGRDTTRIHTNMYRRRANEREKERLARSHGSGHVVISRAFIRNCFTITS
jgi:hypothetical protein